ncbi:MAG: type transport system permease protein [Chloroflexota bacterium]|jgi:ABC-type transport system involved in multi-copper enzyme maturation permease subunit|nr:type transport system permease protein [Chloroflexota bacterium]
MAVWTFARLTLHEAARSRFVLLTAVLGAVYIALIAWGCHTLLDFAKSPSAAQVSAVGIEVMALFMISFVLPLVAVFVAGASTHHDGETGLLQAMLTRPIRRAELVVGKWLGAAMLLAVYTAVLAGGVIGAAGLILDYYPPHPFLAGGLLWLEALVVLSLRMLFGTFLGNMASGILPLMLYGLGWMGGLVESLGQALDIQAMVNGGITTSLVIPTDALWRGVSYFLLPSVASGIAGQAVGRGNPLVSFVPIAGPMVIWAVAYVTTVLALGGWLFARRDV